MRRFETYEKVKNLTEPKDCERIEIVIQTGGNNPKVKHHLSGMEAFTTMFVWTHLTPKGVALVFSEKTKRLLGYIALNENQIPVKYKEPEELYFKDMYEEVPA